MSEKNIKTAKIKLGLSLFWFLFTFSLVLWWWIFSLHQLELLVDVVEAAQYQSVRRMLIWEGAVLVVAVFVGGAVLVSLTYREHRRNERLKNFFSNYSHDLKTALTRLRLRTEVLAEKNPSSDFQKLLEEANRLDLQLENSLWIARMDSQKLRLEKIKLSQVIAQLRAEWPELQINLAQDATIKADLLALKSVFRNIFQNAWLHGQAVQIDLTPQKQQDFWTISVHDNGRGFSGDLQMLGREYISSRSKHGNGLGLYLTTDLVKRMGGQVEFLNTKNGFGLQIKLPAGDSL